MLNTALQELQIDVMLKYFCFLVVNMLLLSIVHAQSKTAAGNKSDTLLYYLNSTGHVVDVKDSAEYFLLILPPDTAVDKQLFRVNEYYKNGKVRMVGNSVTDNINLKFKGTQITYFPNGHKMQMVNYNDGIPDGDEREYYPNGKLYCLKTFIKDKPAFFDQYNDSTGKVITTGGTGTWRTYMDEKFQTNFIQGEVALGLQEGIWEGIVRDSIKITAKYKSGELVFSNLVDKSQTFTSVEQMPGFPGGLEAFYKFLAQSIRYPATAFENNIQGKVVVQFIVEKDGRLTNFKILRSVGGGCDEEAIRVLSSSPRWLPGMQANKPVKVYYTVPISFTIEQSRKGSPN